MVYFKTFLGGIIRGHRRSVSQEWRGNNVLRRMIPYFRGVRGWALLTPTFMALEVYADVWIPRLMGLGINEGVLEGQSSVVWSYGGKMLFFAFLALLFGAAAALAQAKATHGLAANLRHALYAKVQDFSFGNLDAIGIGSLITRLSSDVERVRLLSATALTMVVRSPLMLFFSFLMAYRIHSGLSLVFLFAIPLMLGGFALFSRVLMPGFRQMQQGLDHLNERVRENLKGMRVVKSFGQETHEKARFEEANDALTETNLRVIYVMDRLMPLFSLLVYATVLVITYRGGSLVIAGEMLTGDLISFIMYVKQILMSVLMISFVLMRYARGKASGERVLEVLDLAPEITGPKEGIQAIDVASLEIRDLSFAYPGQKGLALDGLNLLVQPGQTVAIIGSTGAGKTSLLHLLLRLYEAKAGEILIGGQPIEAYALSALRSQMGLVLQQNTLFKGTIRSNLAWGDAEASEAKMKQVLEVAQALDFVLERPEGLEAEVTQGGKNFSGGQRQRLCLARALMREAPFLLLDDAMSALDTLTEAKVQAGLREAYPQMTKILVAQRIASVKDADQILVMEAGRLVGQGSHAALLQSNQVYQEIAASQQSRSEVTHGETR